MTLLIPSNNPFNDLKIGDIYIEDGLFDDNDSKDRKKFSDEAIETINLTDDVPFVDLVTNAPKKVKIVPHPTRGRLVSNSIKKKYQTQRQKGSLKKANESAGKC